MDPGVLIGILAALLCVSWLWWSRTSASDSEAELRRICFGDEQQVNRLIDGEMRRGAGPMTRAEAARRAIDRHRRDNR